MSFNQDQVKGIVPGSNSLSFKYKSNSYNLEDSAKAYKNPVTNRTDNNSNNSNSIKKSKARIKHKC